MVSPEFGVSVHRQGEKAGGHKPGHDPKAEETKSPDNHVFRWYIETDMLVEIQMNHVLMLQEETAGQFEARPFPVRFKLLAPRPKGG